MLCKLLIIIRPQLIYDSVLLSDTDGISIYLLNDTGQSFPFDY
jgi:hypothetical protein